MIKDRSEFLRSRRVNLTGAMLPNTALSLCDCDRKLSHLSDEENELEDAVRFLVLTLKT